MIVMGIDPGQTGGFARVSEGQLLDAWPMPLEKALTKKPTLDFWCAANAGWKDAVLGFYWRGPDYVVIESVHAMPAQGVSSSFQFGRMFGAVEMLAQFYGCEIVYVTPQKWKKHFNLLKTDKAASVAKATGLYGDEHWKLKKHEGVAEAALIATWGLHQLTKE